MKFDEKFFHIENSLATANLTENIYIYTYTQNIENIYIYKRKGK